MDYKKKYENALPYIKDLIEHNVISTESAGKYFPELKENEDEKIRESIIENLKGNMCRTDGDYDLLNKQITWLEKQGEQKQDPCNNCKDVMLNCHNFPCVKKKSFKQGKSVLELIKEESQVYKTGDDEIITYSDKLYQPKFKVGDTMRTLQEASNGITNGLPVVVSIDNEYYHCNNELIAIKDQDNYEYPPMNRRQNPAWSEEDEKMLNSSVDNLTELMLKYGEKYGNVGKCIDWLKSLRPQNTWKPSDKQIEAFEHFVRSIRESGYFSPYENNTKLLYSLLEQLKKLKGE